MVIFISLSPLSIKLWNIQDKDVLRNRYILYTHIIRCTSTSIKKCYFLFFMKHHIYIIVHTNMIPNVCVTKFYIRCEYYLVCIFSSVQFSHSVVSDSLQRHESQHARTPCPLPTPRVHSDSWPSSQWCHPAISSSVIPFSSCLQSLPASECFPMSQLFA